ncbi:MAG: hypothetical protein ACLQBJ_05605 [Bryobacteraceae bacterium]
MKNRTFATLGLLALLATASAFAQQHRGTFNIPFEFSTGDKVMPAGQYEVSQPIGLGSVELSCSAHKVGVLFLTRPVGSYDVRINESRLVFNKYGDRYFLSSVSWPGYIGSALPISRIERDFVVQASLAPASQVVLVARR